MKLRITLGDKDITEQVDEALRREAVLNEVVSGHRDADVRAGLEVQPAEPDDESLN